MVGIDSLEKNYDCDIDRDQEIDCLVLAEWSLGRKKVLERVQMPEKGC